MAVKPIPVTVFTGFLGAGKTTIILSLLPQLPKEYKIVLLKNEFGDIEVDSQLAKQSSLTAVSEILNGCMCCVLVGQMKVALLEIKEKYAPDRIIIESSGSAFPATLAFQIRQLEEETRGGFKLDAIVTVIGQSSFGKLTSCYEDRSVTAKMQAQYTDVILLNKWENVSERHLDLVIDHLNDLNDETPRLRCSGQNGVSPSLIFGLDSKLYLNPSSLSIQPEHNDEVETVTLLRNASIDCKHGRDHNHPHLHDAACMTDGFPLCQDVLANALTSLSKDAVWRVKGFVCFTEDDTYILNWAFGRYDLTPFVGKTSGLNRPNSVQLTVMGARGEVKQYASKLANLIGAKLA